MNVLAIASADDWPSSGLHHRHNARSPVPSWEPRSRLEPSENAYLVAKFARRDTGDDGAGGEVGMDCSMVVGTTHNGLAA